VNGRPVEGPVARGLRPESSLRPLVQNGLQALRDRDRNCIHQDIRRRFGDSLSLDDALERQYPNEPRWDYLLGDTQGAVILALEVHPARKGKESEVIRKKQAAQRQLQGHLRPDAAVHRWYWAASGAVDIPPTDPIHHRLAEKGISFVGRNLRAGHLD